MFCGEIDYEYMKVAATSSDIANEIFSRLNRKGAGGATLNDTTITFRGGVLCGIILNWSLLAGITSGKIAVNDNKIKYSLSFLEIYLFMATFFPLVYSAMIFSQDPVPIIFYIVPPALVVILIFIQEKIGRPRFRMFLESCIQKAEEKVKR